MLSAQNISRPRPGQTAHVSPEGIIYCTDGKFRWVYAIDQRKEPTMLLSMLWKYVILCVIAGAVLLAFRLSSEGMAAIPMGLAVIALLALLGGLVALIFFAFHLLKHGPFRCLVFTADEETVSCQQVKGKMTKEKVAHAIAVWVGGQSQPALRFYDADTCSFERVSTIRALPAKNTIRIGTLTVLADEAAFPLVLDYFKRQCPEATVKE